MLTRLVFVCGLSALVLCAQNPPSIRSSAEAQKLEASLDSHPDDVIVRAQLLRYYRTAGQSLTLRRKHVLWFIEHHPEHSALSEYAAIMDPSVADPEGFAECSAAWQKALAAPKPSV